MLMCRLCAGWARRLASARANGRVAHVVGQVRGGDAARSLLDRCRGRPTAQEVESLGRHTIGGRPSRVILTTVRQRIGCRTGRADHASR